MDSNAIVNNPDGDEGVAMMVNNSSNNSKSVINDVRNGQQKSSVSNGGMQSDTNKADKEEPISPSVPASSSTPSSASVTHHQQIPQQQQQPQSTQHDSILYGSYIDDSYVGDFSGDCNPELVDSALAQPEGNFWSDESKDLDRVLEFSFDSFGPESMLFPARNSGEMANYDDSEESKDNQHGRSLGYHTGKEDNHGIGDSNESSQEASTTQLSDISQSNVNNSGPTDSNEIAGGVDEVENQLKDQTPDKIPTIEGEDQDAKKISLNEDIASCDPIASENSSSSEPSSSSSPTKTSSHPQSNRPGGGNLKRNTSLTMSQRRRIRPKMKIEEIFNTSDESGSQATVTQDSANEKDDRLSEGMGPNNDVQNSMFTSTPAAILPTTTYDNFDYKEESGPIVIDRTSSNSPSPDDSEALSINQGTLGRKKISANRDLLISDDLINDLPRFENKAFDYRSNVDGSSHQNAIPELSAPEETNESRAWRDSCPIGDNGEVKKIDLKVIEPYKKVLSHGGYYHHYNTTQINRNNTNQAIIIFSACYLPDRSRKDYDYVMNNLFMYVLTTLHELVADDYILIYFHNAGGAGVSSNNMPTYSWLKRCYTMIDRRLRKNLKSLLLVHPTFWLKTFVTLTKLFTSSKFSSKLRFVSTLADLNDIVPIESTIIPPPVKQVEYNRMMRKKKKDPQ
ncbi:uncharacterized protein LOC141849389 isoform X2 [Brevipalpus obovatus]|uniref:uncharacterized protein LOC141849389 isoform X2 n=1 Tax=Brevipalpus obovatus TaxID=246614 RepID=UPI003D9E0186